MSQKGQFKWQCPSNIALIKYWGKYGDQLPSNPSISYTLDTANTQTELKYSSGSGLNFLFEGKEESAFTERIQKLIDKFSETEMPFLKDFELEFSSTNSFPHSSGIASSASGMGALALCLVSMEKELGLLNEDFLQRVSHISRLASGSACRSIYPGLALWGKTDNVKGSSDLYAIPMGKEVDSGFLKVKDAILIVSKGKKTVSSSAGHALMNEHAYSNARFNHARKNMEKLLTALKSGDWNAWGKLIEQEAMTLHAMMMSSESPYLLMEPNTIAVIRSIWEARKLYGWNLYFTLDAGPNVHLLYPESEANEVEAYINEELVVYCDGNYWISDQVGQGPVNL